MSEKIHHEQMGPIGKPLTEVNFKELYNKFNYDKAALFIKYSYIPLALDARDFSDVDRKLHDTIIENSQLLAPANSDDFFPEILFYVMDIMNIGDVLDKLNENPEIIVHAGNIITDITKVIDSTETKHYFGGEWNPDKAALQLLTLSKIGVLEFDENIEHPGFKRGNMYKDTEVVLVGKQESGPYIPISDILNPTRTYEVQNRTR